MLNKVQIIGRLGKDPEIRYAPSGDAIANISVATTETWKDKNSGERQERTEWHRVAAFGKLAEIVGQYLHKGDLAYFEGKLVTRKWQDQSGQDRYTTEISVDSFSGSMKMLETKRANDSGQGDAPRQPRPSSGSAQPPQPPQQAAPADLDDSDVPF